ncbi:MAG TPA: precorrin-3B C(17)-methyltransferase [Mycobacteriales bacterium]|nr:precorrin-3B C(17)-methyltransferase [Mycobacteriales bacterium]
MTGTLYGVGVGPGASDLMTVRAVEIIKSAPVIAYHCARHGRSTARAIAAPYLSPEQIEEELRYPVTVETTDHPGGYDGALADFYEAVAERLAVHLTAGRDVAVLCEGDPSLYGSYQHLHVRLKDRFAAIVVPGISSVAAAAAASGVPLVQHDEVLTVLPGTLPDDQLADHLAGTDAAAILKLGRTFTKVRGALHEAGLLERAIYVEKAGRDEQRVAALAGVDPESVPYMSLALVPGIGVREKPKAGLTVIGLGPGDPGWLTPEVATVLAEATDLVGYRPYLERIPKRPNQERHATGNTVEAERAAHALDLAAAGKRVVVVSSGDPGVFAMASAVCEVVAADPGRWADVEVRVLPGVTAAQAVASRVGAPLGHDYCVISLSDRLKPWEVIVDRLTKAADADLVIALYNPASRSRRTQLVEVRDLLVERRGPQTAVIVGRAVGRHDEAVSVTTLGELDVDAVDMSTMLIIGSSTTEVHERQGQPLVFTPRTYGEPKPKSRRRREIRTPAPEAAPVD